MEKTVYKLTDANGCTRGGTQWGEGVRHDALGTCADLCSDGWIHWYDDPLLAVLHDPIHGVFGVTARLWEAETHDEVNREGAMKGGSRGLTTLREIQLPVVTTEQRIRYAILCTQAVIGDKCPAWSEWADKWLSAQNHSEAAAAEAKAAAWAVEAAAWAVEAAAQASWVTDIDLIVIAKKAIME